MKHSSSTRRTKRLGKEKRTPRVPGQQIFASMALRNQGFLHAHAKKEGKVRTLNAQTAIR